MYIHFFSNYGIGRTLALGLMKKVGCEFCEMAVRRKSEMPEIIARLETVTESLSQFMVFDQFAVYVGMNSVSLEIRFLCLDW
jgi:hypothetical protein